MAKLNELPWMDFASMAAHVPDGRFESPAEYAFLHQLVKHLADGVQYEDHVSIETLLGRFVLDYVVRVGERAIGMEIDGKEFHDETRDMWRDAAIIETGELDTIYRIRAGDFYRYPHDCLFAIAMCDPAVIAPRSRTVLENASHEYARRSVHSHEMWSDPPDVWLWVDPTEDLSFADESDPVEVESKRAWARSRHGSYSIHIRRRRDHDLTAKLIAGIRRRGRSTVDAWVARGLSR